MNKREERKRERKKEIQMYNFKQWSFIISEDCFLCVDGKEFSDKKPETVDSDFFFFPNPFHLDEIL